MPRYRIQRTLLPSSPQFDISVPTQRATFQKAFFLLVTVDTTCAMYRYYMHRTHGCIAGRTSSLDSRCTLSHDLRERLLCIYGTWEVSSLWNQQKHNSSARSNKVLRNRKGSAPMDNGSTLYSERDGPSVITQIYPVSETVPQRRRPSLIAKDPPTGAISKQDRRIWSSDQR